MIRILSRALLGCAIVALVCALMCVAIIALPLLLLGTLLVEVIEMLFSKLTKARAGWRPPKPPPPMPSSVQNWVPPRPAPKAPQNMPLARFPQEPPFRNPSGPAED